MAIYYCHSVGIVHRDLKPTNILYVAPEEPEDETNSEIKVIDFGLASKINKDDKLHAILGTPYYVAPEVLKGKYDEKCDIWSIGAIAYYLLYGTEPFKVKNKEATYDKILKHKPLYKSENSNEISLLAEDFIENCLNKNHEKRPSAKEALEHQWIMSIRYKFFIQKNIENTIFTSFKSFNKGTKLKRMVLHYLYINMGHTELRPYKKAFLAFDSHKNGLIDIDEIKEAFKFYGKSITDQQLRNIMLPRKDFTKSELTYSEFITFCINLSDYLTPEKILNAFCYFDVDGNSVIDEQDIYKVMLRWGRDVTNKEDLGKIIDEVLNDNDDNNLVEVWNK